MEGLACEIMLNDLGTLSYSLTPINAVGVRAKEKKFNRGYQYQCCRNITRPTMEFCLRVPSRVVSERVALRPAELITPWAKMAPMRDRISSCLSSIILVYNFLIVATFGS